VDENYAFFIKQFGPPTIRQDVPKSSIAFFQDKLPEQMIEYWRQYGWCGYMNGLFWTVNPQDYEAVLSNWLNDTKFSCEDTYHVIARGAFGELYVWGEQGGYSMTITASMARYYTAESILSGSELNRGVRVFFSSLEPEENDVDDLFQSALESLGELSFNEMYGFVPALPLGGSITLKNLQIVKAVEHLEFLSQIVPLADWGFPDISSH